MGMLLLRALPPLYPQLQISRTDSNKQQKVRLSTQYFTVLHTFHAQSTQSSKWL